MDLTDELLRDEAISTLVKNHPKAFNDLGGLVTRVADNFLQNKLYMFPKLCEKTREVNADNQRELRESDSDGWSEERHFKIRYIIPTELYYFMINMVCREFWSDKNKKINTKFMEGILKGYDSDELLKMCKVHFEGASNKFYKKISGVS